MSVRSVQFSQIWWWLWNKGSESNWGQRQQKHRQQAWLHSLKMRLKRIYCYNSIQLLNIESHILRSWEILEKGKNKIQKELQNLSEVLIR